MVRKNGEHYNAGDNIASVIRDVESLGVSTKNPFADKDRTLESFEGIIIPDNIIEDIRRKLIEASHDRVHELAEEIDGLVLSEQEVREFAEALNPNGIDEVKIQHLTKSVEYFEEKAREETDPRKKALY